MDITEAIPGRRSVREYTAEAVDEQTIRPLINAAILGHFRALLNDPNFQIFCHAPVLILISAGTQGPWTREDCALAAENLMLAAHAMGLRTC
jgi:nitroreductase